MDVEQQADIFVDKRKGENISPRLHMTHNPQLFCIFQIEKHYIITTVAVPSFIIAKMNRMMANNTLFMIYFVQFFIENFGMFWSAAIEKKNNNIEV